MNSLNNLRTINPSPDELLAAYDAFGELPAMEALPRLVMIRRAVAVGFYNEAVPPAQETLDGAQSLPAAVAQAQP